ncbi:SGNH/GDSL hydrolase family protein [Mitsuokella jalaludinii]|uniref:SGNH/GDSL hydrolase family protein n=1 Tax=Mitsuokella jalaludinii TaxID=187979 RepID=UPI00267572FF|nr:SGNH/GDSL hydrolase family protein [uncultured Mitsuokella sp.]
MRMNGKKTIRQKLLTVSLALACLPGTALAASFPATAPAIHYEGRWQENGGCYEAAQGAVYLETDFTGTRIAADLQDHENRWLVSIDGGPSRKVRAAADGPTVLAEGLTNGRHTLRLERATEGSYGISHFRGLEADSLEAPARQAERLRLEFVGDSITAGFRNDGIKHGHNDAAIEDGSMAFAPQLARLLGADYSVVAKSGEGVVHNWGAPWPDRGLHTEERYRWTLYGAHKTPGNTIWQSEKLPVSAVILALGTNDFSDKERRPYHEEYVQAWTSLMRRVHAMNPEAPIICLEPLPAAVSPLAGLWIEEACERAQREGIPAHYIALNEDGPLLAPGDFVGDGTHPTKSGSARLARYLAPRLAPFLPHH